jgi:hypothetical protein
MHRCKARIATIEKRTRAIARAEKDDGDAERQFVRNYPLLCEWLQRHEGTPLVGAVVDRVAVGDFHANSVWYWLLAPYACWAPVPAQYEFPDALLRFFAESPTPHWAATLACTVCGLKVPRLTHPNGGQPFATCPSCGSPTNQRAIFGPPGTEEFESGLE